ncbi:MAG: flotillin [Flavobacteriales bacterium]|jgi:flotillin
MEGLFLAAILGVFVLFFIIIVGALRRYKRCPSDRILVIYGRVGRTGVEGSTTARSSKCIHGGAAFVWPVIQDYAFLDLTPISIEVDLANALSRQNIRVNVPSRFTVGISTEPGIMTNAAERLLGQGRQEIHDLAKDIIFGQLRLVVATMDIEEINNNRDKFLANVASNVEAELKKIGLTLINVNVTDITDESGYIEALGKEAAAKAINDAKRVVAEKNRDGSIGEAIAQQQQRVEVASANATANIGEADAMRAERIETADANARAVEGENTSKIDIAKSDAERRTQEAEATRKAMAAEKVKEAKALEEAYQAQKMAEDQRAERDRASKHADIVVPAEIAKLRVEIDAEAEAQNIRRIAKGEADAIYAKLEAEARGTYEILSKQADGFRQLVAAAGENSNDAVMIMIADKLPELVRLQSEAIQNIKIDKVTVWDGNNGGSGDGKTSTANFLSGMYQSVPPLEDMFKMAGMQLPKYLKGEALGNEKPDDNMQEGTVEE